MIIIDANEATNTEVIKAFKKAGVAYEIQPLVGFDFTNTKGTFVAERKGQSDWYASMSDNRLNKQSETMYENYKKNRFVFVKANALTNLSFSKYRILKDGSKMSQRPWIYGQWGICESLGVQVREYNNLFDLAWKLKMLDQYLGIEKVARDKPKKLSKKLPDKVKNLMGFPGVGKKIAIEWLKQLKTLENIYKDIIENDGLKSDKVKGIKGGKRPGKIVLNMKEILTK